MSDIIEYLYSRYVSSRAVSIDTRTIQPGSLFFAVSGVNFNANRFAKQALEKGGTYAVVDDEEYVSDDRMILVENGLIALQELAIYHRSKIKCPVLAITGSNGKTTTKELIAGVLSQQYTIHYTQGNYNNHIGVPLTLLNIHPQVEIVIIEMGANHVGEIQFLCDMVHPTHGLITNIGHAHTETFGGIEGVLRGKSELFDYLKKNSGQVFLNISDPRLANMAKCFDDVLIYPTSELILTQENPYLNLKLEDMEFATHLTGRYNYANLAAAVAVGQFFDVAKEKIRDGIAGYLPDNARSQILLKGGNTIIMDAYNANPDSMKAALENLATFENTKVAILGDMNELADEEKQHLIVYQFAKEQGIDHILTTGKKMGKVDNEYHFDSKEKLVKYFLSLNLSGAVVLLKASRSIQLETVLKIIG